MYRNIKSKIYRTVSLSVLCGCETWSLTLREEHSLKVLENRLLREIFGSNAGKITGRKETAYRGALRPIHT
jgi:hypothetical protein